MRLVLEAHTPEIIYIPGVTNMVADTTRRLEYVKEINTQIINMHVQNKALAKSLCCYVKATSEFEPIQMGVKYLLPGMICTDHGLYQEYWYNNMLVVAGDISQVVVCNGNTAWREQETFSKVPVCQ